MNKKADDLKNDSIKAEKKIAILQSQISNIDSLQMEYEIRKEMVAEQSKVIVVSDTPTLTYQYLLRILTWMKRSFNFDFATSENSPKDTSWHEYMITGHADYRDVLALAQNIEHQRAVLTIEDLSISSEVANSDTVLFSMVFRTHFSAGGVDFQDIKPKEMKSKSAFYQLFKSRIYDTAIIDQDLDPTLLVLEQCKMIGIGDNRIFIRNEQGVIRILTLRDKVAYGYLYAIDSKRGKAIFIINKFGIPEEYVLTLTPQ